MHERRQGVQSLRCKSVCAGCGKEIQDQYVLRVSPDLEWHPDCLRCVHCRKILDENDTCFVRNQNVFCKPDYVRLFGSKCDKCESPFGETEYVMKLAAENKIFHLDCFSCLSCGQRLVPGDKFVLKDEGFGPVLLCKEHFELLEKPEDERLRTDNVLEENAGDPYPDSTFSEERIKREENDGIFEDYDEDVEDEEESRSSFEGTRCYRRGSLDEPSSSCFKQGRRSRIGRVRTVLSEKQLNLLMNCYNTNPRPDAHMKERMVEMTGLSSRVIRVWFQNKRCKDKKRLLKKEKESMAKSVDYGNMSGIPMIASPPIRAENDFARNYGGTIQSYPSPWKGLREESDFGAGAPLGGVMRSPEDGRMPPSMMYGYPGPDSVIQPTSDPGYTFTRLEGGGNAPSCSLIGSEA